MRISHLLAVALCAVALAGLAGCTKPDSGGTTGSGSKQNLTIKGSDTMVQLSQGWAQEFMKTHPDISITVTGGGSGTGISALKNKATDIANSSRPMKDEEKAEVGDVKEFIVAQDALAIIVHPSNPVIELTMDQLKDIYTARVTNWNQLGAPEQKIVINSRETSSGTYVFFQEHVLGKETPFASTALLQPSTSQIVDNVGQDRGGIGYVGLGYLNEKVKVVKIRKDAATPGVQAAAENVLNKTYPLARPLYNYTAGEPGPAAKTYLDWVMGPEGQAVVTKLDFVPIK